jgi:hypothetical protein
MPLAAAFALAACSDDDSPTEPNPPAETRTATVDASQGFGYFALGDPGQLVTVTDPTASDAWDMGFFATAVTLNGGAAGPGSVSGYCVCQNANAATPELQAMTPENQLAAFDAVTEAQIPAESSFESDELVPVISGWYTGAPPNAAVTPSLSWLLRESTSGLVGKFRVTSVANATATSAGDVTFEYALQPAAGGAFGAVQTRTVTVGNGTVYFDLTAGAVSDASSWDVAFTGYTIQVNGGVSGSGGMTALPDDETPFDEIDATYASSPPPQAFRTDEFGGVFAASPWYRYNITGTDNQIWPTFNVYLIRKGDDVFKVQLTGYYGTNGAPRQIGVRYQQLR